MYESVSVTQLKKPLLLTFPFHTLFGRRLTRPRVVVLLSLWTERLGRYLPYLDCIKTDHRFSLSISVSVEYVATIQKSGVGATG